MKLPTLIIAFITFFSVYAFADAQQSNENKGFVAEFQVDANALKSEFQTPVVQAPKIAEPKKVTNAHYTPFVDNYEFIQVVKSNEQVKEYNKTNALLKRHVSQQPMNKRAIELMALFYKADKVLTLKYNNQYYFYFFSRN
jgi:hypothetical protein